MLFGFEVVHGSGNVQSRTYDLTGFRSVRLAGIGTLSVQQTGEESVRIEADDNLFDYMRVELRGSELHLGLVNGINLRPPHTLRFFVTVKDIEAVSLSGSGDVITSALTADQLRFDLSGSGDIESGALTVGKDFSLRISGSGKADIPSVRSADVDVTITGSGKIRMDQIETRQTDFRITGSGDIRIRDLQADSVDTRVSGSGDIDMSGKVTTQRLSISSSGKYMCEGLQSDQADIHISGAGKAQVDVNSRLDVRISGSGSVYYLGKPLVVSSISGAGKVKSL